jgi:hypothetical protein
MNQIKSQSMNQITPSDVRAAGALMEIKSPGLLQDSKYDNWTVAHFTAAFGTPKHMAEMCKWWPYICNIRTSSGLTPFQVAIKYNNKKTARVLFHHINK